MTPQPQLSITIVTTGTGGTLSSSWAQDPYQLALAPEWRQPPADPIAEALKAAGSAVTLLADNAKDDARAVLNLLTDLDLSAPRVVVEDNEITMEWYKDRHHVAVVAVDGQSISWAVMAGIANPMRGKKQFNNELPAEAYNAIRIAVA